MFVPEKAAKTKPSTAEAARKSAPPQDVLLGFLTVIGNTQSGLYGGYLLINSAARPVEFHCSAPVQANRAQQILYGPTLEPYLFGELIAATLISSAKNRAALICTDCAAVLIARKGISTPMVLVATERDAASNEVHGEAQPASHQLVLTDFDVAEKKLAAWREFAADVPHARSYLEKLGSSFDLVEPFERIRLAIQEAQRGAA